MSHKGPFNQLYDEDLRLLLFGGKGGVGKTTVAAACSLYLSDIFLDRSFLIVSTDPAHSLSDSFQFPLGSTPGPIYGRPNLCGLELDSEDLLEDFRRRDGPALRKILSRGTYLDEEDLSYFLQLPFPGLDEVMALLWVIEALEEGAHDLIILDTAPTGHTLQLLDLPTQMEGWIPFLETLMAKHRYLSEIYTHRYKRDEADAFIKRFSDNIRTIREYLQNKMQCRFVPITLAEPMVLSETDRLLHALLDMGLAVPTVLINRVRAEGDACINCKIITQRQRSLLTEFLHEWPDLQPVYLPQTPHEVKGEKALRALGAGFRYRDGVAGVQRVDVDEPRPVRIVAPSPKVQVMLFCGKGGVGKTTLASAIALNLTSLYPQRKILLLSIDPAHSLSDRLGMFIGQPPVRVVRGRNLFAMELDAVSLFKVFKRTYASKIDEIFSGIIRGGSMEVHFDREAMVSLMNLAPPGLDEIMALAELADMVKENEYDLFVVDTAPTGHALRFLELPHIAREWLKAFFRILLKYKSVMRVPEASQLLVDLSRRIKGVQNLLSDLDRCECVLVAQPYNLVLEETVRLAAAVRRLDIPVKRLLLNRVPLGMEGCPYCEPLTQHERRGWQRIRQIIPDIEIVNIPDWTSDLTGIEALSRLITIGRARRVRSLNGAVDRVI